MDESIAVEHAEGALGRRAQEAARSSVESCRGPHPRDLPDARSAVRDGTRHRPKLDATTDPPHPVIQGGQQVLIPVGSTTFRSAILETQPLLGLHGHIHETKNAAKLKRSVLVDPGSEYASGTLRGAIVNLQRDRVLSYQFTTG